MNPIGGVKMNRFWKTQPVGVQAGDDALSGRVGWLLLAFFVLAVLRLWAAQLGSSLALDETGTFWVVKDGLGTAFERLRHWDSISPAYAVVAWAALALGGAHEFALRLPSLLSMAAATWLLYRLGARLVGREMAFTAAAFFVCLEPVVYAAGDARPYALLLLIVVASTTALVRWLDHPSAPRFSAYVLLAALLLYTHYLAFTMLTVHAVFALWRWRSQKTAVALSGLCAAALSVGLLLLPLVPFVLDTYHKRQAYSYAGQPARADLFVPFVPVIPCVVLLAALLPGLRRSGPSLAPKRAFQSADLLILSWAVIPVLLLFSIAKLTTAQVFLPRYALPAAPGLALLLARIAGTLQSRARIVGVGVAALLLSVLTTGPLTHMTRDHTPENWREAVESVNSAAADDTPVIVYTYYAEANQLGLWRGAGADSNMFSPLSFYKLRGHFVPFGMSPDQWIERDAEKVLPELEKSGRFLLVQPRPIYQQLFSYTSPWRVDFGVWLEGRLATAGFRSRVLNAAASPAVLLFERNPGP